MSLRRHGPVSQDVMIARQLSQQGMDAIHRGRYEDAEQKFASALEHCPSQVHSRYQLANCLWKRGAQHEAIEQLEAAVKLMGSEDVEMLVELGYMHANVGRLDLALQRAESAVAMAPECPEAWQLYGDVQREVGQWQSALASYQRALSYDRDNIEALLACAHVYEKLQRPARTLSTVNHLEAMIPTQHRPEEMLTMKSEALVKLQRYDEVLSYWANVSQDRDLSTDALAQMASAQAAAGDEVAAQETIRLALRAAPPAEQAHLRRLMNRLANRSDQPRSSQVR